jgi:hypothetical protein
MNNTNAKMKNVKGESKATNRKTNKDKSQTPQKRKSLHLNLILNQLRGKARK